MDAKTCGEQMVEKTMRLYELSLDQFNGVYEYCKLSK